MTTTTTEVTLRELRPDEGKWLYRDEDGQRLFSQHVYLGVNADPADWRECGEAEKTEWENSHKEEGEQ